MNLDPEANRRGMPAFPNPAWTSRLRDVFGTSFAELRPEHIEALVPSAVREAADPDFKATLYGKSEDDKRELCKDIAAMRNDRGGVIVLGVAETTVSRSLALRLC